MDLFVSGPGDELQEVAFGPRDGVCERFRLKRARDQGGSASGLAPAKDPAPVSTGKAERRRGRGNFGQVDSLSSLEEGSAHSRQNPVSSRR